MAKSHDVCSMRGGVPSTADSGYFPWHQLHPSPAPSNPQGSQCRRSLRGCRSSRCTSPAWSCNRTLMKRLCCRRSKRRRNPHAARLETLWENFLYNVQGGRVGRCEGGRTFRRRSSSTRRIRTHYSPSHDHDRDRRRVNSRQTLYSPPAPVTECSMATSSPSMRAIWKRSADLVTRTDALLLPILVPTPFPAPAPACAPAPNPNPSCPAAAAGCTRLPFVWAPAQTVSQEAAGEVG